MRPTLSCAIVVAALLAGSAGLPGGAAGGAPPDSGPPFRVTGSYPGDRMVGLMTDPFAVRFNQPVDPATVTAASVRLLNGSAAVPGSATAGTGLDGRPDPRMVVWTPYAPLPPAASWRLWISRDVRSIRGRPLADPFSAGFTTNGGKSSSAFLDLDPGQAMARPPRLGPVPRVNWTSPLAGLGNVYTDDVIIRFSRPMDEGSFAGGTFTILQGGTAVPGVLSVPEDGGGREVQFTPEHPLFRDTAFRMVVTRDARTERGRYLRRDFEAPFGTSPFKGGVKPVLPTDFVAAAPLAVGRAFHTATPLLGGDILVAGGEDLGGTPLASCTIYRASSGTFEAAAPLLTARRKHAAVPTRTGGVMVIGGFGPTGTTLSTVEVYDPAADSWTQVASMAQARASETATVVSGSRILVAGGFTNVSGTLDYSQGAEVFNPITGAWTATTGPLQAVRGGHSATLLPDGRVLLAGGTRVGVRTDELYVPATDSFVTTFPPLEERIFHAACLTRNGTVLLAGGGPGQAEQFDPASMTFSAAGSCPPFGLPVTTAPYFASLTLIPGGGRIALIGGLVPGGAEDGSDIVLDQVQLWDPGGGGGVGAFNPMLFDLKVPRAAHTVNQLPDGSFLIMGGLGTDGISNERSVTIFKPSL